MTIGIIGGSGFLGKSLAGYVLKQTDWNIRVISHTSSLFAIPPRWNSRVTFVVGDVLHEASLTAALRDVDVAYYFVHMMGQAGGNFYEQEMSAAKICQKVIDKSRVTRLVYMGGLGNGRDTLSAHLESRHKTGRILRSARINVVEFQASMVIGRGSVAFDIIANLVDKLPIMLLPHSAATLTQPIILDDALEYLTQAATVPIEQDEIVQIGGPDVLSYTDIYRIYANQVAKRRFVVRIPFAPAWIEAQFLNFFTPKVHTRIGQAMVESLSNEMVMTSFRARELFPTITPRPIEPALKQLA